MAKTKKRDQRWKRANLSAIKQRSKANTSFEIAKEKFKRPKTKSRARAKSIKKKPKTDLKVPAQSNLSKSKFITNFNNGIMKILKDGIDNNILIQSEKDILESILSRVSSNHTKSISISSDKFTDLQLDCSKSEVPNSKLQDKSSLGYSPNIGKHKKKRIGKSENKSNFDEILSVNTITIPDTSSSGVQLEGYQMSEIPVFKSSNFSQLGKDEARKSEIWTSNKPLSNQMSKSTFSLKINLPHVDYDENKVPKLPANLKRKPFKNWSDSEVKLLMKVYNSKSIENQIFSPFRFPLHVNDRINCLMKELKYF